MAAEPTNEQRADWAYSALYAFAKRTNQQQNGDLKHDRDSVVGDLLANLMHLCDRDGISFARCLANGRMHYRAERDES